jgi:hypothetical protein
MLSRLSPTGSALTFAAMAFLIWSCDQPDTPKAGTAQESMEVAELPRDPLPPQGDTLFTRLPPSATGVEFQNRLVLDHPMDRLYHSGFIVRTTLHEEN